MNIRWPQTGKKWQKKTTTLGGFSKKQCQGALFNSDTYKLRGFETDTMTLGTWLKLAYGGNGGSSTVQY